MAADFTAEIVPLSRSQLDWLGHALAVVQLRNIDEQSAHLRLSSAVRAYADSKEPTVVLTMQMQDVLIALWAANEGRVRNQAERMIRGELQRLFEKLSGIKGVNHVE